jgi:L-alanine-DL-glutamate epimerase-like enolase superfamily enzyme
MPLIDSVEVILVALEPPTKRQDAIQSFVRQETPILRLHCSDGSEGVGYSYTIGTGGSSVMALLRDHLVPRLIGQDPDRIEAIWRDLLFHTHATHVGAITSLALAAIDTALWDRRCKCLGLPLWKAAGGAKPQVPVYTTEGGWLQLSTDELVAQALQAQRDGFAGSKVKIGRPHVSEDVARLQAVRAAVGPGYELMVDANQSMSMSEALRRARALEGVQLAWLEEPMPADNLLDHQQLCRQAPMPIAVGESLYSVGQFADYLQAQACHIVQVDVARIGGITPWLKVAHMAECQNVSVCPHFLMELHVSLSCAVPNAPWVEYIPQLDSITHSRLRIAQGCAVAPEQPGLGIDWNWPAIDALCSHRFVYPESP